MMQELTTRARSWRARARCAAVLLLLALPLAAQAAPLATFGNGETITPADFRAYVGRRVDLRDAARNYWGAEQALSEMALTRVLTLEGGKLGVARRSGADESDRFDDIYALAVYKRLAPACERPADDAAARAWFDAHPEAFVLPPTARLTRIILPLDQDMNGQSAMSWLFEQATAITTGQVSVDEVAQEAEKAYRLDAQGDLGWVPLEGDSAVLRALAAAKPGDLLGPLEEGRYGYLFYLAAKRDARQLTWDEARSSVPQRAVVWCREKGREQVRDELFARYRVAIDKKAVREMFRNDAARQAPGDAAEQ